MFQSQNHLKYPQLQLNPKEMEFNCLHSSIKFKNTKLNFKNQSIKFEMIFVY